MLTDIENTRYSRQIALPGIGSGGQQKLKSARVLVVGAGGLGCPVLQYLVAAGIGTIGICDGDIVDLSNLQRQVLYAMDDVGKPKALAAKTVLEKQNPLVQFLVYENFINEKNAFEIISGFDVVVDGTDNFGSRYILNDACVTTGKPLVFGSVFKFEGQVSVFNFQGGPTYRCLYPETDENIPNCSEAGVLGVLPGITACLQANETLKIILGLGDVLSGKLLVFNSLSMNFHCIEFEKNKNLEIKEIQSKPLHCNIEVPGEINIEVLKARLADGEKIQLVDLRESYEKENEVQDALSVTFAEVLEKFVYFDNGGTTVLFCTEGNRSRVAVGKLSAKYRHREFLSLKGGAKSLA